MRRPPKCSRDPSGTNGRSGEVHSSLLPCPSTSPIPHRQVCWTAASSSAAPPSRWQRWPCPVLSGRAGARPASPWRMRLAFSSVMLAELPIEEVCARAARLGFEAIDIWCPFGKCKHLTDVVARLGPDGLKELLAKHKLALASFTTYCTGAESGRISRLRGFHRQIRRRRGRARGRDCAWRAAPSVRQVRGVRPHRRGVCTCQTGTRCRSPRNPVWAARAQTSSMGSSASMTEENARRMRHGETGSAMARPDRPDKASAAAVPRRNWRRPNKPAVRDRWTLHGLVEVMNRFYQIFHFSRKGRLSIWWPPHRR